MYSEKFLKNSIKLLRSPFLVMFQTSFTQRALKRTFRHSKGTRGALKGKSIKGSPKALQGHLDTKGTRALKHLMHSGTRRALVHSSTCRSSPPEVLLGKDVLKIRSKFTGEHPCQSVISINLLCNFIEITLHHGWFPVNLPHIFRTLYLAD